MTVLSTNQLWSLVLLFQIGSNVVFGFGSGAKQDAWIAAGISCMLGCGLIVLYAKICEWGDRKNWVELLEALLGRYAGKAIGMIYIVSFIYVAGRVLRDFGELIATYILPRTPIGVTMFLFLFLAVYAASVGLERMARLAELCIPIVLAYLLILLIFILFSETMDLQWLFPVASDWKAIGTSVFPLGVTVPYGESIVFTMLYTFVRSPHMFRNTMLFASASSGLLLIILDFLAILTLGPDLFARTLYPLLVSFQLISLADFIENVDPLVVTIFLFGGLFKILIFFYGACIAITSQWRLRDHRSTVLPVAILVWLLAFYMTDNISSHIFVGLQWVPWVMWIPLFIIIPLLLLPIAWWKRKGRDKSDGKNDAGSNSA